MASVYARRHRLYCKVKDSTGKWVLKPTPFDVGEETKAIEWAERLQAAIDRKAIGAVTVAVFAAQWLVERKARNLAAYADDVGRINNHVLPALGHLAMTDVRPRHVRDFLRTLKASEKVAPRTVINILGVMKTMFDDAVIDEVIPSNPCLVKAGEKPEKVDADPEWRAAATYRDDEVIALMTDDRLAPERRVLNALKALAGLRHGEAAGARWRSFNHAIGPLGQLLIATSYNKGRTKTNTTRKVPVHPLLARMLEAWRTEHWARVYGRSPTDEDLIVPTRNGTPIDPNDSNRMFKRELALLGLRVEAGELRDRGGHDLRAWHLTALQETGANRDIVLSWTHTKKADVASGYSRFSWLAMCAEMGKLVLVVDGDPLRACSTHVTRDLKLRNRYQNTRPRRDSKAYLSSPDVAERAVSFGNHSAPMISDDVSDDGRVTRHVPHSGGPDLLGALRDFALVDNPAEVAELIARRARGEGDES